MRKQIKAATRTARTNSVLLGATLATLGTLQARGADATWVGGPTNGNWVTSPGETNWNSGDGLFPGSTAGNSSTDVALFNGTSTTTAIVINSPSLNIRGITFDGAAPAYTIGATNGNSLLLSNGGVIQLGTTASSFTGPNITETVSAPLVLAGGASLLNNSTTTSNLLVVNGGVSGLAGNTTLTLGGANTSTNNQLQGVIANGGATSLAINKIGAGTWRMTGSAANTYNGLTSVSAGELGLSRSNNTGTAGAAINGNMLITGGKIKLYNGTQIADTSALTISNGGFDFGGKNETIGSILQTGGTVYTSDGVQNSNTATIVGTWDFRGGNITVNSGGSGFVVNSFNMTGGGFTFGVGGAINTFTVGSGGLSINFGQSINIHNGGGSGGSLKLAGVLTSHASAGGNFLTMPNSPTGTAGGTIDLTAGNRTFIVHDSSSSADLYVSAILTNGSLTKAGGGTLQTLNKNRYTGSTTISGPFVEDFNFASASSGAGASFADNLSTGALTLNGGNLQIKGRLNGVATSLTGATWATNSSSITVASTTGLAPGQVITATGIPANAFVVRIIDSTRFQLSASPTANQSTATTITAAANSASSSQTFNGLTLLPGGSILDANNNASDNVTVDLRGAAGTSLITRNAFSAIDFRASGGGVLGSTSVIRIHDANDPTGILGAWATVNSGTDWAMNDGADMVAAYAGHTNIAAQGDVIPTSPAANVRINSAGTSGNLTLAAATTDVNTLMQGSTTAATIDNEGGILRVAAVGGILVGNGQQALTIGTAANSGTLTAGGADNTAGELILNNSSSNPFTVNSVIADNGSGAVSLVKSGTGVLTLAGTNTYTGPTWLVGGNTAISSNSALGNQAMAAALNLNGGALSTSTSFGLFNGAAGTNDRPVVLSGAGGGFNTTGGTLSVSGVISGDAGAPLVKSGGGNLLLTGANTYAGATMVNNGTLLLGGNGTLGNATGPTHVSSGAAVWLRDGVTVNGETITLWGNGDNMGALSTAVSSSLISGTWAGNITLGTNGARIGAHYNGILNITGAIEDGPNSYEVVFSGEYAASGSNQTGVIQLSGQSTYGGWSKITRGIVKLGTDNALPVATTLDVHDNNLTGDRSTFDLNGFNQAVAGLKNSATSVASVAIVTNTALTPSTLTVNAAAATTYPGALTGNLSFVKTGSAAFNLTGQNSHTGATTVSAGTLALAGAFINNVSSSNTLIVGDTTTPSTAILDVTGLTAGRLVLAATQILKGTGTVNGAVTVASDSIIAPGNGVGTLTTGDQTWAGDGSYEFEINNPGVAGPVNSGIAGADWDKLAFANLNIAATSLAGDQFRVDIVGDRGTWAEGTYNWIIASGAAISGFTGSDQFVVSNARLVGALPEDTYSVTVSGQNVVLSYTAAVPEPGTLGIVGVLAAGFLARRRRR